MGVKENEEEIKIKLQSKGIKRKMETQGNRRESRGN